MSSKASNNNTATVISGLFFLAIAGALLFVTFSLRTEAQGREINVTLADLYAGKAVHGDYITVQDTGVVISAASDIVDEFGSPLGRAFILNGIPNYVFLVGSAEQFTDTTGKQAIGLQAGTLIPVAFHARVSTLSESVPLGMEEFAIANGMSTGQKIYSVETGVTRSDTSVPFYLTMAFGIIALMFSGASWWSLIKKKSTK